MQTADSSSSDKNTIQLMPCVSHSSKVSSFALTPSTTAQPTASTTTSNFVPTSKSTGIELMGSDCSKQKSRRLRLRQGRPVALFPKTEDLPWHFSWVSSGKALRDSLALAAGSSNPSAAKPAPANSKIRSNYLDDFVGIGGSSLPCERFNYPAMLKEGVGLIVNLTEAPVTPGPDQIQQCTQCNYDGTQVWCEPDIFDDVFLEHGLEVLHLPIRDGHIPHPTQVEIFLKSVSHCINERGRRVTVHCHAGVGRTGTMLALYLMSEYKLSPEQALQTLRHDRPQSLQYNPDDWFEDPFIIRQPEAYERNLLQERFLCYYYQEYLLPSWSSFTNSSSHLLSSITIDKSTSFTTLQLPGHVEIQHEQIAPNNAEFSISPTASTSSSISTLGVIITDEEVATLTSCLDQRRLTDSTINEGNSSNSQYGEEKDDEQKKSCSTPFNNSPIFTSFSCTSLDLDSLLSPNNSICSPNDSLLSDISASLEEISIGHGATTTTTDYVFVPKVTQEQVDQELATLLDGMARMHTDFDDSKKKDVDLCFHCRGILSIGPVAVNCGDVWPPKSLINSRESIPTVYINGK